MKVEDLDYTNGVLVGDRFYSLDENIDAQGWAIIRARINGVYPLNITEVNVKMFKQPEMFYILSLTHVVTDELIKNFPSAYSTPGSLFIIRTDDKAMICVLVDDGKGFVSFVNIATGTRVIPSAASIYDAYLHLFNRYGIAMSITFLKNLNGVNSYLLVLSRLVTRLV